MNRRAWREKVTPEEAYARAAGRRRYNIKRHMRMEGRRAIVKAYLKKFGNPLLARGGQTQLARALGVHRSVISHDIRALRGRPYR
jgi:hypothetical protein